MTRWLLVAAILAVLPSGAAAQQKAETAQFAFQSSDATAATTKSQRYCLPAGQHLVRIDNVEVAQSNSASKVNITPDPSSPNCVMMTVELPPARKICTKIPVTSGPFQKVEFDNQCTVIPTSLGYTIHYTAEPAAH